MITIGINDNNGMYLDSNGNIVLKKDIEAMGDIFINKSQTVKGELLYSGAGIDFFNTIFGEPIYSDLFQNQVISELAQTAETQNISGFTSEIKNNVYSYTVNCQTSYGEVTLNG